MLLSRNRENIFSQIFVALEFLRRSKSEKAMPARIKHSYATKQTRESENRVETFCGPAD